MKVSRRRSRNRGGQGGHEPRPRIRQREQEVIELATAGRSQHEIAGCLGITQAAVSKILKRVDARWLRENQDRLDRHKVELTRKLDHVYREALRAWEQSKAQHTRRRQRKTGGADADSGTMAEVVVDDSHGDARYLEVARRALADLARLWHGEAAVDAAPDTPTVFTLRVGNRTHNLPPVSPPLPRVEEG